ncbi:MULTISPECIES: H-NS histone family protein [Burkholderia]|uniref:H-NS histone family protein n=1 Tax=Burkholderia TaxID=32008 RepID=UPI0015E11552|nr:MULTISPECIES: H-NS histone family protein [unclassified Burkholderia]
MNGFFRESRATFPAALRKLPHGALFIDSLINQREEMRREYLELLEEHYRIHREIVETRDSEVKRVISGIVKEMLAYGISLNELKDALTGVSGVRSRRRAHLPMYINPQTGQTWSGRGRPPTWIADRDRSKFLITSNNICRDIEAHLPVKERTGELEENGTLSQARQLGSDRLQLKDEV